MALLPETPAELEQWCRSSFYRKEKRLQQFYATGSFGQEVPPPVSQTEMEKLWRTSLLFWFASSVFSVLSLALVVGWFGAGAAALLWFLLTKAGGVDMIELKLHGQNGLYRNLLSPPEPKEVRKVK
mmetsp:Transcript_40747/g.63619  ORF Transcript_40747/g.63619 Transcript_40747/m.63619 type:complete len:126 (+) Transcript_40747:58-435(+)